MPRYFFTTIDGGITRDTASADLPDIGAARRLATEFAGDLVKEVDGDLFDNALELRVTDDVGLVLLEVSVHATESPAAKR